MATKNQSAGQKAAATKAANKASAAPEAVADEVISKAKTTAKAKPVKADPAEAPAQAPKAKAPKAKEAKVEPVAEAEVEDGEGDESDADGEELSHVATRANMADDLRERLKEAGFGMSPKLAKETVKAFEECVAAYLAAGTEINFPGFGKFKLTYRAPREQRNPRDGSIMQVGAQVVTAFKPGAVLKKAAAEALPLFVDEALAE